MALFDSADTASALARLTNVPVSSPVGAAQILRQTPATRSIGNLDPSQVTGLLGQAGAATGQNFDAVSTDKGIGKFGLTPQQLQDQGFLKPGTVEQFIGQGNADFTSVLQSPSCWTGKGGATNLDGFLKNPSLQNGTQVNIMEQGLNQLKSLGVATGNENPQQLAALVQGAAKFGAADMAAWTKGSAPADIVSSIDNLAKDAQFAVDLVDTKIPNIGISPEGAVDTVDREALDSAITSFFGSGGIDGGKIPVPTVGPVARAAASKFETSLYSNTPDQDLIYTGDDNIVWDRINTERLKRGLKSLTDIGIPRPPDTSTVYT